MGPKCSQFHALFCNIWQNRMLVQPPSPLHLQGVCPGKRQIIAKVLLNRILKAHDTQMSKRGINQPKTFTGNCE